MAVVLSQSDLFTNPRFDQISPDPAKVNGRGHVITGTVTHGATDSLGSLYKLATVPADAILGSNTTFVAAGSGFATTQIGTKSAPTALVNAAKATHTPNAIGDANHGLPLWQQLGMTAPPASNMIDLYQYAPAAATGAGSMKFEIHYRWHS
jgi:hypothetical protein